MLEDDLESIDPLLTAAATFATWLKHRIATLTSEEGQKLARAVFDECRTAAQGLAATFAAAQQQGCSAEQVGALARVAVPYAAARGRHLQVLSARIIPHAVDFLEEYDGGLDYASDQHYGAGSVAWLLCELLKAGGEAPSTGESSDEEVTAGVWVLAAACIACCPAARCSGANQLLAASLPCVQSEGGDSDWPHKVLHYEEGVATLIGVIASFPPPERLAVDPGSVKTCCRFGVPAPGALATQPTPWPLHWQARAIFDLPLGGCCTGRGCSQRWSMQRRPYRRQRHREADVAGCEGAATGG